MRNRFTVLTGTILIGVAILWMFDIGTGFDVPWEWVLPVILLALGLISVLGRSGGSPPPSQFERDDAPRVP